MTNFERLSLGFYRLLRHSWLRFLSLEIGLFFLLFLCCCCCTAHATRLLFSMKWPSDLNLLSCAISLLFFLLWNHLQTSKMSLAICILIPLNARKFEINDIAKNQEPGGEKVNRRHEGKMEISGFNRIIFPTSHDWIHTSNFGRLLHLVFYYTFSSFFVKDSSFPQSHSIISHLNTLIKYTWSVEARSSMRNNEPCTSVVRLLFVVFLIRVISLICRSMWMNGGPICSQFPIYWLPFFILGLKIIIGLLYTAGSYWLYFRLFVSDCLKK